MAVRILLLIVVTGLFATAWNSDRPEAAMRRLASDSRPLPERPASVEIDRDSLMVAEVGHAVSVSAELDVSIVVPPELIAPGTYRVVDAQGRVGWMSIPVNNSPDQRNREWSVVLHPGRGRSRHRVASGSDRSPSLIVGNCNSTRSSSRNRRFTHRLLNRRRSGASAASSSNCGGGAPTFSANAA
jgi:hypothetical protein